MGRTWGAALATSLGMWLACGLLGFVAFVFTPPSAYDTAMLVLALSLPALHAFVVFRVARGVAVRERVGIGAAIAASLLFTFVPPAVLGVSLLLLWGSAMAQAA